MNFSRMVLSLLGWVAGLAAAAPVVAQDVAIPNLWDPRARQERPDLSGLRTVRFLTDDDFPPLHFVGPDGAPPASASASPARSRPAASTPSPTPCRKRAATSSPPRCRSRRRCAGGFR